jgi:hypothetical protein
MLSEEKIIRMTKLAAFEKREGKKNLNIVNYYRNDYIGFQVLKSIIAVTISFVAVFALYLFYNFEALMHDVYKLDLMEFGKSVVIIYLCVAAAYGVITYVVYAGAVTARRRRSLSTIMPV